MPRMQIAKPILCHFIRQRFLSCITQTLRLLPYQFARRTALCGALAAEVGIDGQDDEDDPEGQRGYFRFHGCTYPFAEVCRSDGLKLLFAVRMIRAYRLIR